MRPRGTACEDLAYMDSRPHGICDDLMSRAFVGGLREKAAPTSEIDPRKPASTSSTRPVRATYHAAAAVACTRRSPRSQVCRRNKIAALSLLRYLVRFASHSRPRPGLPLLSLACHPRRSPHGGGGARQERLVERRRSPAVGKPSGGAGGRRCRRGRRAAALCTAAIRRSLLPRVRRRLEHKAALWLVGEGFGLEERHGA